MAAGGHYRARARRALSLPILLCHGTVDEVMPSRNREWSTEFVQSSGFSYPTFKSYNGATRTVKDSHEKFKQEVKQQLLGYKNSLEDFEAYHAELKGVADKQMTHKKLLQHAEKTVGSQLNDAEIKIVEVRKRAQKKMNGLKYVLKELITETAD